MRSVLPAVTLLVLGAMVLGLILWGNPGSVPTGGGTYRLVESQKTLPAWEELESGIIYRLAENAGEYRELWDFYRLHGAAPAVDWESEVVLFVGTGESGSCPLRLAGVDVAASLVTVRTAVADPNRACTDDYTPRTFVIALRELPAGGLQVRLDGREARDLR